MPDAVPFARKVRDRASPVREIQNDIRQIEHAADDALASAGEMIARVIRAARLANLETPDTQAAIVRAGEMMALGLSLRSASLATHGELRELAGKVDLRTLGWGDTLCPPDSFTGA